jgi:hypothetical protein
MPIHHLDWEDEAGEERGSPGDPARPEEPPPIAHAPVAPLTTPDETAGG